MQLEGPVPLILHASCLLISCRECRRACFQQSNADSPWASLKKLMSAGGAHGMPPKTTSYCTHRDYCAGAATHLKGLRWWKMQCDLGGPGSACRPAETAGQAGNLKNSCCSPMAAMSSSSNPLTTWSSTVSGPTGLSRLLASLSALACSAAQHAGQGCPSCATALETSRISNQLSAITSHARDVGAFGLPQQLFTNLIHMHPGEGMLWEVCACHADATGLQSAHASRVTDEAPMLGRSAPPGPCSNQSKHLRHTSCRSPGCGSPERLAVRRHGGCEFRGPLPEGLRHWSCLCQCWLYPLRRGKGGWLTLQTTCLGTPTCDLPCDHSNDLSPMLRVLQGLYQHLPAEQRVPHDWSKGITKSWCDEPRLARPQDTLHKDCQRQASW